MNITSHIRDTVLTFIHFWRLSEVKSNNVIPSYDAIYQDFLRDLRLGRYLQFWSHTTVAWAIGNERRLIWGQQSDIF